MGFIMALAKRSRTVRGKKKAARAVAKKSSPKRRPVSLAVRKRLRRIAVRRASKAMPDRILREYHMLVDKKLQGIATAGDLADLQQLKVKLQAMQDEQTAEFAGALEQRHNAIIEKLSSLTDELRRYSAAARQ